MRINCNYMENSIILENGKVSVVELENKKFFYRFIKDLYSINNGDVLEEMDKEIKEFLEDE